MTETLKQCRKCGLDKPADGEHWYFDRGKPSSPCKSCRKEAARQRYQDDPEFRNSVCQYQRERYRTEPDYRAAVCQYQHKRRQIPANKAARRDFDKKRDAERRRDPDFMAWRTAYALEYGRKRYHSDPKINIDRRIQAGIRKSLRKRGAHKTSPKAKTLGWTIDELMNHLEPLFEYGMTWDNMDAWHIDHIIPLSAVQYSSEDDPAFKWIWSLSNLAPLWANDNQEKLAQTDWVLPDTYKNPRLRALYEDRNEFLLAFG